MYWATQESVFLRSSAGRVFHRDRVHVDDTEVALVIIEHGRPILDRTEVVADRQLTGRLGASENNWLCFTH
jgi:hypothetical protein